MIKHFVVFKLKDFPDKEKEATAQKVQALFTALPNIIPEIKQFEVGINTIDTPFSYDVIINSAFDNIEDLKHYQAHPAHQAAVAANKELSETKVVIDYLV